MYDYIEVSKKVHRIIPSKFPPILLFDWAETPEELEQIAALEGLTNDRLSKEYGGLSLVSQEDWVGGEGSTPLMAAFTHIGYPSRFSDATYGIYYAGDSRTTAVKETVFHRERFYRASQEPPCKIGMREYTAKVLMPLIQITNQHHANLLNPDPQQYKESQDFGKRIRAEKHWGIHYPSVRNPGSFCIAIFRPPALSIPVQSTHLEYIWDGGAISHVQEVRPSHQLLVLD